MGCAKVQTRTPIYEVFTRPPRGPAYEFVLKVHFRRGVVPDPLTRFVLFVQKLQLAGPGCVVTLRSTGAASPVCGVALRSVLHFLRF